MERRKAKISIICVSVVMILSMLLTFLGVYAFKNPLVTGGNNAGITAGLDYDQDNYVGAVSGGSEAYIKENELRDNGEYEEIKSDEDLCQFLLQEGKYSAKHGFLSQDVTLDWTKFSSTADDSKKRAGLAPLSVKEFKFKLDGCGNTITFEGSYTQTILTESLDHLNIPLSECMIVNTTTRGHKVGNDDKPGYNSPNVTYHAFGGMLNVLGEGGGLKNFKFVINSNHGFHYNSGNGANKDNMYGNKDEGIDSAHIAFGGLVGYNNGGTIDNVAVELAENKALFVSTYKGRSSGNNNGVYIDYIFASRRVVAAVFQGLVVGVSDGGVNGTGKITNVCGVLKPGSRVRNQAGAAWWTNNGNDYFQAGASIVGGIAGGLLNKAVVSNAYFYAVGTNAFLDAQLLKFEDGNQKAYQSYRAVGGIVGANMNGTITSAMVTKNLNCMRLLGNNLGVHKAGTEGTGAEIVTVYSEGVKDIFVGEGARPTTMIYKNATGGDTGVPEANRHPNSNNSEDESSREYYKDVTIKEERESSGYRTLDEHMFKLNTYDANNEIRYYFSHDSYGKDENENTIQLFDKAMIFVPDGKLLWDLYDIEVYDNLYRGATNEELPNDSNTNGTDITITIGNSDEGEIGYYKMLNNVTAANESQHIYEYSNLIDGKVTYWQEMSDQNRASRKGCDINAEENKLYYDGYTYELKLKITLNGETKLYDQGLRIRHNGNLKHAKMLNGGSPVTLALDIPEGKTEETTVAYANTSKKLLITREQVKCMDRTLSITKRDLIVTTENYVEGESTIFSGAKVTFSGKDGNSGLVDGESILWQETSFAPKTGENSVTIDLNIAGYQMLRPSTNNYVIKTSIGGNVYDESTTFVAHIMPHKIDVADGIYINGAAVNGQYNVVNNKNYSSGVNDTVGNAKNDSKRKIRISTRFNNGHFSATRLVLETEYGNTFTFGEHNDMNLSSDKVFRYIDFTVADFGEDNSFEESKTIGKVTKIYFDEEGYEISKYTVNINDEYADVPTFSDTYNYGELITLQAKPADGKYFTGWQVNMKETGTGYTLFMSGSNRYLSFQEKFSFKVKEKISITACYDTQGDKWLQSYVDSYGQTIRRRIADNDQKDNDYDLNSVMGSEFAGWKEISRNETNKTITFQATYGENPNPAQVQLIFNDDVSWVNYGTAITLKKDKSYVVNGSLVNVVRSDIEIYAINNLIIMNYNPSIHKDLQDISLRHRSFKYENVMYINITFTYGEFDHVYDTNKTDKAPNGKPVVNLLGFNNADITEYVRQGNIYQISIVIDMQELAFKFGNDCDIVTSLEVEGVDFGALEIMSKQS